MADENLQMRQLMVMVLLAVWLAAVLYSVSFLFSPTHGGGFVDGLRHNAGFLGWQGIAGMVAFTLWAIARGFPKGSGARRISNVPLGLALLLVLMLAGPAFFGMPPAI